MKKRQKKFLENDIDSVIHFAAFKAVGESVEKPLEYYYNNLTSALVVLKTMRKHDVRTLYLVHLQQFMEMQKLYQ